MKDSEAINLAEKIKVPDIAFIHILTGPAPTTLEDPPEGNLLLTVMLDLSTRNLAS